MDFRFWTLNFYKNIGYSLRSSEYLSRRLLSVSPMRESESIIELGAGEGQVTKYIIKEKNKSAKFIAIENDHDRCTRLREQFGTSIIIHEASAAHLDTIVEKESVDLIISTLPLGSISQEGVDHILRSIHFALKPGGAYIQYQYWMYNRRDISRYFTIKHTYWEPRNSCPAFIYKAEKKQISENSKEL